LLNHSETHARGQQSNANRSLIRSKRALRAVGCADEITVIASHVLDIDSAHEPLAAVGRSTWW